MAEDEGGALLVVRSPSLKTESDFKFRVKLDTTVSDIKAQLSRDHPEHPEPDTQRLIFAGQMLQDTRTAGDVLGQRDLTQPQVFHLMTQQKAGGSADASSSTAAPVPQRQQTAPAAQPQSQQRAAPAQPRMPDFQAAHAPAGGPTFAAAAGAPTLPAAAAAATPAATPASSAAASAAAPVQTEYMRIAGAQSLFRFEMREIGGQPYVFTVPVLPSYMPGVGLGYSHLSAGAAGQSADAVRASHPVEHL